MKPPDKRVAVGGLLHGEVVEIPNGVRYVYRCGSVDVIVRNPTGDKPTPGQYEGTDAMSLYEVQDWGPSHATRLLIDHDLLTTTDPANDRLEIAIHDALAIAAGIKRN